MDISPQKNLPMSTEEVYRDVRRRIVKLKLEPGQKISENQMCQEYGVSRSVIRMVFNRLNHVKFVEVYPQRGTYVSMIDLDYISDILLLRTAVEKEILYQIFQEVSREKLKALIEKLEENLAKQEEYRHLDTYEREFRILDTEFHRTMIDSVKHVSLIELLDDHMIHLARWRNFDVSFDHRMPELIDQHRAIMEAIKEHDLEKSQRAIAWHLATVTNLGDRAKATFPQYFI